MKTRILRSCVRNASASSTDWMSGSVTISTSGNAAPVHVDETRVRPAAGGVDALPRVLLEMDLTDADAPSSCPRHRRRGARRGRVGARAA